MKPTKYNCVCNDRLWIFGSLRKYGYPKDLARLITNKLYDSIGFCCCSGPYGVPMGSQLLCKCKGYHSCGAYQKEIICFNLE